MDGPVFGSFDQIIWVSMDADGPTIACLDQTGIYDDAVHTTADQAVLDRLFGESRVMLEPVVIADGQPIDEVPACLELVNGGEAPMDVRVIFSARNGLAVEPDLVERTVPAGTTERVVLSLTRTDVSPNRGRRSEGEVAVTFDVPGKGPVTHRREMDVAIAVTGELARRGEQSSFPSRPVLIE